jgi:aspartyl protease family protein
MKAALGMVVAIGLAIGFLIPGSPEPAGPAAGGPAAATAEMAKTEPRQQGQPAWGGETRLTRRGSGHFYADALVNGRPVEFVVDTGATTVALTVEDARRIGIRFNPADFEVIGSGASGPVRGVPIMIDSVSLGGKEVRTLRGAVLEGLGVSLLGQAYLSRISSVTMTGREMILK